MQLILPVTVSIKKIKGATRHSYGDGEGVDRCGWTFKCSPPVISNVLVMAVHRKNSDRLESTVSRCNISVQQIVLKSKSEYRLKHRTKRTMEMSTYLSPGPVLPKPKNPHSVTQLISIAKCCQGPEPFLDMHAWCMNDHRAIYGPVVFRFRSTKYEELHGLWIVESTK